ncbi:hypothetical protein BH160DRAFT_5283, partial [Burkholderia sp. H160]
KLPLRLHGSHIDAISECDGRRSEFRTSPVGTGFAKDFDQKCGRQAACWPLSALCNWHRPPASRKAAIDSRRPTPVRQPSPNRSVSQIQVSRTGVPLSSRWRPHTIGPTRDSRSPFHQDVLASALPPAADLRAQVIPVRRSASKAVSCKSAERTGACRGFAVVPSGRYVRHRTLQGSLPVSLAHLVGKISLAANAVWQLRSPN